MTRRVLAALFGAVLFGVAVPIVSVLLFGVPFDSVYGLLLLVAAGVALGAALGARFPGVFGFVFEVFLDV